MVMIPAERIKALGDEIDECRTRLAEAEAEVESLRKLVVEFREIAKGSCTGCPGAWTEPLRDLHCTDCAVTRALAATPDSLKGKVLMDEGAVKEVRGLLGARVFNHPLSEALREIWDREALTVMDRLSSARESEANLC